MVWTGLLVLDFCVLQRMIAHQSCRKSSRNKIKIKTRERHYTAAIRFLGRHGGARCLGLAGGRWASTYGRILSLSLIDALREKVLVTIDKRILL